MSERAFRQFIFGDVATSDRPLSAADAERLVSAARAIRDNSSPPPQAKILDVFSRLSRAWSDPGYPPRRKAAAALAESTGLSGEFITAVLNEFPRLLAPETLLKKIEGELGSRAVQEEPVLQASTGARLMAAPAGLVLHVASGSVFMGGVDSLIDGMITRNVNFLKMSTDEMEFPVIFAESLKEFDRERVVITRLAVLWWKGGDAGIENAFKSSMDRIIFWGGGEALSEWEEGLAPHTVLARHGPKISFGVISRAGLKRRELSDLTDRIAIDIAAWEQRACNCPQALFVENSVSPEEMKAFTNSLVGSMRRINSHFPPSRRSDDEYVEVLRTRELALAGRFASGEPVSVFGPETLDWTVIAEESAGKEDFISSPLNRTVTVRRYSSFEMLARIFRGRAFYLQTAGYCLDDPELPGYAKFLSALGVTRLCPFGAMTIPAPGAPHDGGYLLRDLVRYTVVE